MKYYWMKHQQCLVTLSCHYIIEWQVLLVVVLVLVLLVVVLVLVVEWQDMLYVLSFYEITDVL